MEDAFVLPVADEETVKMLEREVVITVTNRPREAYAAKIRLAWGLAHSQRGHEHHVRALRLIEDMLHSADNPQAVHELLYLKAVARLNAVDLIGANKTVTELLNLAPDSHQALALRDKISSETLKKGLIGLGILAGAAALCTIVGIRIARRR